MASEPGPKAFADSSLSLDRCFNCDKPSDPAKPNRRIALCADCYGELKAVTDDDVDFSSHPHPGCSGAFVIGETPRLAIPPCICGTVFAISGPCLAKVHRAFKPTVEVAEAFAKCPEYQGRARAAAVVSDQEASVFSLTHAIRFAAYELPDGFEIRLRIEKGAGWVSLDYPGAPFAYEPKDASAMTLSEQILDCIEKAKTTPIVHVR
jgi:hypothetical protein